MSYKEKNLGEPVEEAQLNFEVSLNNIGTEIAQMAEEAHIPIKLDYDEAIFGNIFNSSSFPLLIISHPGHQNNYAKVGLVAITNYGQTKLNAYFFGNSPVLRNDGLTVFSGDIKKAIGSRVFGGSPGYRSGASIGYAIGSTAGRAIRKVGFSLLHSSSQIEEEKAWYSVVAQIISNYF